MSDGEGRKGGVTLPYGQMPVQNCWGQYVMNDGRVRLISSCRTRPQLRMVVEELASRRQVSTPVIVVRALLIRTKNEGGVYPPPGSKVAKMRKTRWLPYIQEAKWNGQTLNYGRIALGDIGGSPWYDEGCPLGQCPSAAS